MMMTIMGTTNDQINPFCVGSQQLQEKMDTNNLNITDNHAKGMTVILRAKNVPCVSSRQIIEVTMAACQVFKIISFDNVEGK